MQCSSFQHFWRTQQGTAQRELELIPEDGDYPPPDLSAQEALAIDGENRLTVTNHEHPWAPCQKGSSSWTQVVRWLAIWILLTSSRCWGITCAWDIKTHAWGQKATKGFMLKAGQDSVTFLYMSWILSRIGAEIRNQDYTRTGQLFKKLDADKDCLKDSRHLPTEKCPCLGLTPRIQK